MLSLTPSELKTFKKQIRQARKHASGRQWQRKEFKIVKYEDEQFKIEEKQAHYQEDEIIESHGKKLKNSLIEEHKQTIQDEENDLWYLQYNNNKQ